jgi:hypothetical protein
MPGGLGLICKSNMQRCGTTLWLRLTRCNRAFRDIAERCARYLEEEAPETFTAADLEQEFRHRKLPIHAFAQALDQMELDAGLRSVRRKKVAPFYVKSKCGASLKRPT